MATSLHTYITAQPHFFSTAPPIYARYTVLYLRVPHLHTVPDTPNVTITHVPTNTLLKQRTPPNRITHIRLLQLPDTQPQPGTEPLSPYTFYVRWFRGLLSLSGSLSFMLRACVRNSSTTPTASTRPPGQNTHHQPTSTTYPTDSACTLFTQD